MRLGAFRATRSRHRRRDFFAKGDAHAFIDGFVTPIPTAGRGAFTEFARSAPGFSVEFGANRVVDAFGDDLPAGKTTDFQRSVQARAEESVGFGWAEYPDRATRDAADAQLMSDPRMNELGDMPFDGERLVFGGFAVVSGRKG